MDERPTDERRSDQELIGRADLNDVEAILAITNTDDDAEFHDVGATIDTRFTWDYERARPRLGKLYEKAKLTQWNANDLPWQTDVDQEEVVRANAAMSAAAKITWIIRARTLDSCLDQAATMTSKIKMTYQITPWLSAPMKARKKSGIETTPPVHLSSRSRRKGKNGNEKKHNKIKGSQVTPWI